jgi:hypothetical protein
MSTSETVDSVDSTSAKRPTFLTVLCILTFVVSGYHFFDGLIGVFSSDSFDQAQYEEAMNQMSEAMGGADESARQTVQGFMEATNETIQAGLENATTLGIIEMLAAALSLLGAYFMFRLKQMGYYVYIGAKALGIIGPLAILGVNMLTGIIYGFAAFIGILFIVLYGINKKHMS